MHNGTNSFNKKSVGSIAIAALLIFGIYSILPLTSGAYAQGTSTITTSADAHNNRFFGPALLEVMFTSSQHAADSAQGTAQVTVTAFGTQRQLSLNETSTTSGIFLMYVKVDTLGTAANTLGSAEDPQTPATPFSSTNTRLYIGTGGAGDNSAYPNTSGTAPNQSVERTISLSSVSGLEGGQITFSFGGVQKTVTWDDSTASVSLDRSNYGPGATAYVAVEDQDMNLDPTAVNTFVDVASAPANQNLTNGVDKGQSLTYTETGANTGKFEITYTIGSLTTGTSQGRSLTANDFKNFTASGTAIALGSGTGGLGSPIGSSSASYTVQRASGSIGSVGSVTYAGELPLTVSDSDRNFDSKVQETLTLGNGKGRLVINSPAGSQSFDLREQSSSSNTFVPAYGQDRIILTWKQATSPSSGILNLRPGEEATIRYEDPLPSTGSTANTSSITIKPTNTAPTLTSDKTTVGRSSVIELTMNDPELNDDAQVVESYTVSFGTGNSTDTAATNAAPFNGVSPFSLKIDRNGAGMDLNTNFSVTFTETGANTGVFKAEVDLSDLGDALSGTGNNGAPLSDGNTLNIELKDILEVGKENTVSVNLTVGLEKPTLKVDRSTVPVPRLATADDAISPAGPAIPTGGISNAGSVDIVVTITDPNRNNSTINQEVLQGTTTTNQANHIHTLDGGRLVLTLSPAPGTTFQGNTVVDVTDAIQETGFNTGVFQGTITVRADNNEFPLWIGAKMKIEYKGLSLTDTSDDASAVTVTFTARQAALTTDTSTIVNGGKVTFTVTDQDANRDPEDTESVFIRIKGTTASGGTLDDWLELEETGDNTGIFTATVTVGDETLENGATFSVEADSDVDIFYYDATPNVPASSTNAWPTLGGTTGRLEKTLTVGAASGALNLDITGTSTGPSSKVGLTVFDTDENTNPNTKQTITGLITVATDRGVSIQMNLDETDANSGRFEGTINLQPDATPTNNGQGTASGNEVTIDVLPGDVVSVRYEDQNDENGRRTTLSKQFTVVSVDPEIKTDKNVYGAGDQVKVTLADIDADRDADSNDIINVKATSTSDLVGLNVQLIETGPNTGVFEGTLTLSREFSSGSLTVKTGDTVTIKYTDTFPADYKARVDAGGTTSKDFIKNVPIGTSGTTKTTTPSKPELRDAQNRPVTQVLAGQQVVLSTTVKNNEAASTPYAAIVEVRDSNGITVYLNWQTGTLAADGSTGIGLSWTPDQPGTYTARVFVLSNLTTPQILSDTVTSTITVS